MKKPSNLRYLSKRISLLALLQLTVTLVLVASAPLSSSAPNIVQAVALAAQAALVVFAFFWVVQPYRKYARRMTLFSEGYTLSMERDEQGVELCPATDRLMDRVQEEFNANDLLKLSKRQAQYRALQNQINPHFLYNTLESIRSEALVAGLNSVADMTEALAVFFRYTISKVENLVTIEEELQNCVTYFHIQQYRFGARLQFQIECEPEDRLEIYRCRIPKLTLQPILENSIIHGTELKPDSGKLTVKLERTERFLTITVSDNGVGMDEQTLTQLNEKLDKSSRAIQTDRDEKGGVALVNVNNRIHLLFGEEYGLHVFSMLNVGTDVQITLPVMTSDREGLNREAIP